MLHGRYLSRLAPGAADLAEESFFEPMGLASLVVEALFVILYAAGSARRTLTA